MTEDAQCEWDYGPLAGWGLSPVPYQEGPRMSQSRDLSTWEFHWLGVSSTISNEAELFICQRL